jgi:uncharacterized membrane protein YGL010W
MNELIAARRPVLNLILRAWRNWRARHRDPFNFAIHLIGIPLAGLGLLSLLASTFFAEIPWYWGFGGLVAGYFLQFVGHWVEGNDVGEWAAIKTLFGLPCKAVASRWLPENQEANERASSLAHG